MSVAIIALCVTSSPRHTLRPVPWSMLPATDGAAASSAQREGVTYICGGASRPLTRAQQRCL
jgi:hypothetical protein